MDTNLVSWIEAPEQRGEKRFLLDLHCDSI